MASEVVEVEITTMMSMVAQEVVVVGEVAVTQLRCAQQKFIEVNKWNLM